MPSDDKENIMTIHARKSQLIVHQEHPFNAEPPGDLLRRSFLTPQEHFYVRTHGSIPAVDPTNYRLLLTGLVQRKRELSLDELRSMSPAHTVTAKWRGVPLREVLRAAGVEADAQYVAFTSLDEAQFEGERVSYGSSIALEKALSPDVLLAYEMNDEPLAPEHGF